MSAQDTSTTRLGNGTEGVLVRMPCWFDSEAEMAGFVQAAVTEAMWKKNWSGEAAVIFHGEDGMLMLWDRGIEPAQNVNDWLPDAE